MKTRTKIEIGVGVVVVAGVGVIALTAPHPQPTQKPTHHHQTPEKKQRTPPAKPHPTAKPPSRLPTIPTAGGNSITSASASLTALTSKEGVAMPAGPIDIVPNLANPRQRWAFAAEAAHGKATGYTLWFGMENTKNGPWTWIPSTLPGLLSSKLPPAVHSALLWSWDLNQGQPGPALPGTVSWNAIKGAVGKPVGWTAQDMPTPSELVLTVWMPSFYGSYHGLYGLQTVWYPSTISAGKQGLSMITPGGTDTMAQIAQQSLYQEKGRNTP